MRTRLKSFACSRRGPLETRGSTMHREDRVDAMSVSLDYYVSKKG